MYILIAIAVAVLTYFRPSWAAILLYAVLPVYLLKTQIAGIPTTLLELTTYGVFAGAFLAFLFKPDFKDQVKLRLKNLWAERRAFTVAILIFLGVMLLASVITVDLRRSLGVFKGWFFDPALAGLLLLLLVRGKEDLKRLVLALNVMTASLSFYGLWEFFTPPAILTNAEQYNAYLTRVNSIFQSANYHAFLVAPIVVLTLAVLIWNWRDLSKFFKTVVIGALVFNLWSVFLTYSYGAYFGLGLAGLFLLLMLFRENKKLVWGAGAALLLAGLVTLISVVDSPKFQRDFNNLSGDSSLRGRIEVWDTGLQIIKNHFWLGLGLGNFDEGYVRYVNEATGGEPLEDVVIHAHNIFLNFWSESGILGLLAFLFLLIQAFRLLLKARNRGLAYGASAAMVQILGHGLIDTPYFKNDASYLFWLLVFLLVSLDQLQE